MILWFILWLFKKPITVNILQFTYNCCSQSQFHFALNMLSWLFFIQMCFSNWSWRFACFEVEFMTAEQLNGKYGINTVVNSPFSVKISLINWIPCLHQSIQNISIPSMVISLLSQRLLFVMSWSVSSGKKILLSFNQVQMISL